MRTSGRVSHIVLGLVPVMALLLAIGCQQQQDISKTLKPVLDAYVEVWNNGNLEALDAITDPNFELRTPTTNFSAVTGRDSLKKVISMTRQLYPDFHVTIDEETFASDQIAVTSWTVTATNTGQGTFPPTGKHVTATGFSVIHFADGKIAGEWIAWSDLNWMQQLGFTLVPPSSPGE